MSGAATSTDPDESSVVTVFQPIAHPVLRSVDPVKVSQFLRDRERYEIEITEKKKEVPSLSKATYKVSVDPGLLRRMHFLGRFKTIAPDKDVSQLTATHVEKWIKGLVEREESTFDPSVIEKALATLRMQTSIADPEARVMEYCNDFFTRLEAVGYDNFKDVNPKKTVKLLQEKLYPRKFKVVMQKTLDYHEPIQSDVVGYVELLCEEAKAYEKYKYDERDNEKDKTGYKYKDRKDKSSGGYRRGGGGAAGPSAKDKTARPLCLNPACAKEGKRHFVLTECEATSKEEARRLLKEHRHKGNGRDRKQENAKRVHHLEDEAMNSTMVRAMLAKMVVCTLCADGGSDLNLLPRHIFKELQERGVNLKAKVFDSPRKYGLAAQEDEKGNSLYIMCDQEVTMNVELFIRHGCYLELRNVTWYVATSEMSEPIIGRPTLEALGINTKEMLAAAMDRLGSSIDVSALLPSQNYAEGSIARIMSQGIYHQDRGMEGDMFENEDEGWLDLGQDTKSEIEEAIGNAVDQASINGISGPGKAKLFEMLTEYKDVLRLRLGNDPPAKVPPMKVELKQDAKPIVAKQRRYTPDSRKFMERYIDKVIEYGFGEVTKTAKWIAAPVIVAKPPPAFFRITFDYRPVNASTVPMTWPMPHIDSELADMQGSENFSALDFVSGYWQMPLEEESQEALSFSTTNRVIKPTRCTQGAKNSGPNFQSKVEPLFHSIRESLKAWIDDFILHHPTEEGLLTALQSFLSICRDSNLKISIRKSEFFLKKVRWCGRIIDAEGVQFDPRNLAGLQQMHLPRTAAELCEYVHCLQWMSNNIPDFANRIRSFKDILEAAYKRSGSRKKKSVQNIALSSLGWDAKHDETFRNFQEELVNMIKLAHRDPAKALCIYTDASEEYWAGVVTQTHPDDLNKELEDQRHEPLAFLGAAFKRSEELWTTFEKEAYAIYQVFKQMDYLLLAEGEVHLYTDHRNLLFVFNPLALDPSLGRHIVNKVQRWGLYLSRFAYAIEHVDGDRNVLADIMTRWWRGYRGKRKAIKRVTHLLLEQDIVDSPLSNCFEWPDAKTISTSQRKHHHDALDDVAKSEDGIWTTNGKLWIPDMDSELQIALLVISHCGANGHRGREGTLSILKEMYYWSSMEDDCKEFVAGCLHCLTGKTGHKIPRPISLTLHATVPNEVIHFDYLYMGPGVDDMKYALVIRDDLSSYLWLVPTTNADAATAALEISRWIRIFTIMKVWVSDQGSHFKNKVMEALAQEHRIKHNFTVAYSPWVNGTVENCMKHVQAAYRCLQSELRLGPQDWPSVIGMIQTVLNEAPLRRLGTRTDDSTLRTPLEVMTGIRPARTTLHTTLVDRSKLEVKSLERARATQLLDINGLQDAFDTMHKSVLDKVTKNRARQIRNHNKKTNLITPTFNVGDFVLVRRAQNKGHKLSFRWMGPRRIVKVLGELVYDVENLLNKEIERVHAARLLLYRANLHGQTVSDNLLKHAESSEAKFELIEKLLDISGNDKDGFYVQVQWLGLPDKKDWTWQEISELFEDVPDHVQDFLKTTKKKNVAKRAKAFLALSHL